MAPDTSEAAIPIRNMQHLIQLLTALHYDTVDGKNETLWIRMEDGVTVSITAFLTRARNIVFKLNGVVMSRSRILNQAGY